MNESVGTLYVLHAAGHADLGIRSSDNVKRKDLISRLERATDPDEIRNILRLRLPEQDAGREAPLASGLDAVSASRELSVYERVCLVIGCTNDVADIAGAIEQGLSRLPDVYGRRIDEVSLVRANSLNEVDVSTALQDEFRRLKIGSGDRVVVDWGCGSTQLIFGITDNVIRLGIPWSLALVSPSESGRIVSFDPTADLSIDPLIPLLRRWRYHDLLLQLVEDGAIRVDRHQREVLEAEAEQWGRAYVEPNPTRLRAVMAAALMRGDASGGFAVRVYIEQRYAELCQSDGLQENLLEWAKPRVSKPYLGKLIGEARKIGAGDDAELVAAKNARSGQWLLSDVVDQLNAMGRRSSHELKPPTPKMLEALRAELTKCGDLPGPVERESLAKAKLDPLALLPARTVWYLSILGNRKPYAIEQIAEATKDQARHAQIDSPVRAYMGYSSDEAMRMALLIFGTQSGTADEARRLADRLRRRDLPAIPVTIPDGHGSISHAVSYPARAITDQQAEELLRRNLGDDAGALVFVPSGPKQHVLPLLIAAHRIAAELGIPLFLRQLVTEEQEVLAAGIHRLPMRFGTDLGVLSAALRALEIAELDTAVRLLGVTPDGHDLAARVASISAALRCELGPEAAAWPVHDAADLTPVGRTLGLIAERIEVWAKLPNLKDDLAVQSQALIGACATAEWSAKEAAKATSQQEEKMKQEIRDLLRPMFEVRNQLPVTHGANLADHDGVAALVAEQTGGRCSDVHDLLVEMAGEACGSISADAKPLARRLYEAHEEVRQLRKASGRPSLAQLLDGVREEVRQLRKASGRPSLAQPLDEVREEVRQLREIELNRRDRSGQLSPTS